MGSAHPPLIGKNHQPQSGDHEFPFLYGKAIIKMGFSELIKDVVALAPPLSRLSPHSRGSLICIISNDDVTPQLCDSWSLVGGQTPHFQRVLAISE